MQSYHNALAANNTGLPEFFGLPLLDWHEPANSNTPKSCGPTGLTAGGLIVFERIRRPAATCNLIARLAGLGQENDHAR